MSIDCPALVICSWGERGEEAVFDTPAPRCVWLTACMAQQPKPQCEMDFSKYLGNISPATESEKNFETNLNFLAFSLSKGC